MSGSRPRSNPGDFLWGPKPVKAAHIQSHPVDRDRAPQSLEGPTKRKMKTIDTKAEFDQLIATESNLIVVDFFANWCGPCKAIGPHLNKWVEEFDDVVFVKIDVDENDETAEECGISAMPTFHFYKGGKKIDEIVGANHEKIKEKIIALK